MIECRDVSFSYEPERKALDGVSFRVKPGEAVGLIGANGAGKSTLMMALLGLVECEGEILVDGVRVEKRTLSDIRRKLGDDPQNCHTIRTVWGKGYRIE